MNPNQNPDPAANNNATPGTPPLAPEQPVAPQQFTPTSSPSPEPTVIQPSVAPQQPDATVVNPAPAPGSTSGPVYGAPVNPDPASKDPVKSKKRKKLLIGSAIVTVLVILAGLGAVFGL